jgi:hypothetical protein
MAQNSNEQLKQLRDSDLRGEILIRDYEGKDGRVVCLYGDPEGLRTLAEKLIQLADLEQQQLPAASLPDSEGFHLHLKKDTHLDPLSYDLDLGRLDAKADQSTDWFKRDFEN